MFCFTLEQTHGFQSRWQYRLNWQRHVFSFKIFTLIVELSFPGNNHILRENLAIFRALLWGTFENHNKFDKDYVSGNKKIISLNFLIEVLRCKVLKHFKYLLAPFYSVSVLGSSDNLRKIPFLPRVFRKYFRIFLE